MKVHIKSKQFQSFAGLFFPLMEMRTIGLSSLINSDLGLRASGLGYSYSEIVENLFAIFYAGGDCIEDIHSHFRMLPFFSTTNCSLLHRQFFLECVISFR